MATEKPSWEEFFMYIAFGVSMRSKDPKTQVGCVIVDLKTLKIQSIGYNGFPPGISNSDENWSDEVKDGLVVHAEANAVLLKGGADLEGSIAFVTLFPCGECAKLLIQAGVRKVYYLSFRDKYRKSEGIFKAAKVEFVPFRREEDGKLTTFQDRFIKILEGARRDTHVNKTNLELYERLKEKKNDLKDNADFTSQWDRELLQSGLSRSDEVLFRKWEDYFLFLALIASTRSSPGTVSEGALLLDSKTLKMCSLSYKGYPRGVEGSPGEGMMVSALSNVLALRFCEGNSFYAFSTHFPSENEVKNLAQARVECLYFISPAGISEKSQDILKAAKVKVVRMDLLDTKNVEQEVQQTIGRLGKKEEVNTVSFDNWPTNQWTPYELKPRRRDAEAAGVL
ncbi:uncharacterized protein LOC144638640 isoform X2 [Oculina patagonica]